MNQLNALTAHDSNHFIPACCNMTVPSSGIIHQP